MFWTNTCQIEALELKKKEKKKKTELSRGWEKLLLKIPRRKFPFYSN